MIPTHFRIGAVLVALGTIVVPTLARAQETNAMPSAGGGSADYEYCQWSMYKSDTFWSWIYIEFAGTRSYATDQEEGYGTEQQASITLRTTYLPSESITCRVTNFGAEFGPVYTPMGTSYEVQHTNPECDGYPPLAFGDHHSTRNYIDESVGNYTEVLQGILDGQYYWGSVGSELFYTELSTTSGTDDVWFTMSTNLAPNVPGSFNYETRYIRMNANIVTSHYFWEQVAAHELGHAVGFDHAQTTQERSIMPAVYNYSAMQGLFPRFADKCAAVKAFPVNLQ
jgi:hypothetical protein